MAQNDDLMEGKCCFTKNMLTMNSNSTGICTEQQIPDKILTVLDKTRTVSFHMGFRDCVQSLKTPGDGIALIYKMVLNPLGDRYVLKVVFFLFESYHT